MSTIARALERLKIKDPDVWKALEKSASKCITAVNYKGFASTYKVFMGDSEKCSQEFRERLASLLPIHLYKMHPNDMTDCFRLTLERDLMNDHLFDNHYQVLFWKRTGFFGPRNYPIIIRGLVEKGFEEDREFWVQSFLPPILTMKELMGEQEC